MNKTAHTDMQQNPLSINQASSPQQAAGYPAKFSEAATLLRQGYGGISSPSSPQQATGNSAKENHLVLNGLHQLVQPSPPSQNQRVTISLPAPLIERLRNAVYWTEDLPMASLVTEAIEDIVTQMEEANGGAFPQRVSPLKRGRRERKRSPVPPLTPV